MSETRGLGVKAFPEVGDEVGVLLDGRSHESLKIEEILWADQTRLVTVDGEHWQSIPYAVPYALIGKSTLPTSSGYRAIVLWSHVSSCHVTPPTVGF